MTERCYKDAKVLAAWGRKEDQIPEILRTWEIEQGIRDVQVSPKSERVKNIGTIFDSSATKEAQVVKTAQTA